MPDYDFKSLSSYDFELLSRDLLQKELRVRLESFKTGRDMGIDLRYSESLNQDIVVQCKHYANSGFAKLYETMSKKEILKLRKLKDKPRRYIIVTSLALTLSNKDDLLSAVRPFCKTTNDIFGKEDMNNLLGRFPEIERKNFKLWLTSASVLERILHSAVFNRSEAEIETIKRKLKLYVQNNSFLDAKEILERHNFCVISGIPGIGKTTLAEILTIHYIDLGYEAFLVSNNIDEAWAAFEKGRKQVFYYDDFLGQTSLGPLLEKNEEKDLTRLIESVSNSKAHKLILTTREYILNQARQKYERLQYFDLDLYKYLIDLSKYSTQAKARILFNHVYFSGLNEKEIRELAFERRYWQIIDHENYSPRIVEWMTFYFKKSVQKGDSYFEVFKSNLDNPQRIWKTAIENQLTIGARNVLLVLSTMPEGIILEDLQKAFNHFHENEARRYTFSITPQDFRVSLKELEGNMIRTELIGKDTRVDFQNPSIRDFLTNYLIDNPTYIQDLTKSAVFFAQLSTIWGFDSNDTKVKMIRGLIGNDLNLFADKLKETFLSDDCKITSTLWTGIVRKTTLTRSLRSIEERLHFAIEIAEICKDQILDEAVIEISELFEKNILSKKLNNQYMLKAIAKLKHHKYRFIKNSGPFWKAIKDCLLKNLSDIEDYHLLIKITKLESSLFSVTELRDLSDDFDSRHSRLVTDYIYSTDDPDDIDSFQETFANVAKFFEIDSSHAESRIQERLEELPNEEDPDFDDDEYHTSKGEASEESDENAVDNMFDSLSE